MDQNVILTSAIVLIGSILASIPGILAYRRQAKQDKEDTESERSGSVIAADKAAWERTTRTIESLEKKVIKLEGKLEFFARERMIERKEWEAKLTKLEEENAKLRDRIEELEGR